RLRYLLSLFCVLYDANTYKYPIREKRTFKPTVTECPPNELCFKAVGRYGNHSTLSARGCMVEKYCRKKHSKRFKGTVYTMSYSCCDWPYCNSCLGIAANLLHVAVAPVAAAVMVALDLRRLMV
uniref:UPAR/Ly6 domain-containing protein n=1 Tax=Amphiprion percula TaxID=161767 RepID=A0A3P8RRS6_AMPPE